MYSIAITARVTPADKTRDYPTQYQYIHAVGFSRLNCFRYVVHCNHSVIRPSEKRTPQQTVSTVFGGPELPGLCWDILDKLILYVRAEFSMFIPMHKSITTHASGTVIRCTLSLV